MKFRDVRKSEFPEKTDFPVVSLWEHGYGEAFVAHRISSSMWWINDDGDRDSDAGAQRMENYPIWIPVNELFAEATSGK